MTYAEVSVVDADSRALLPYTYDNDEIKILSSGIHNNVLVKVFFPRDGSSRNYFLEEYNSLHAKKLGS